MGTGTSFDVKTLAPGVDYTKLTADNFYASQIVGKSAGGSGNTGGTDCSYLYLSTSVSQTKSYNQSTGVMTFYISSSSTANNVCSSRSSTASSDIHAYLIY